MYQEMHMWDEAIEVAEAKVNFSQLFTTINSHCISTHFSNDLNLFFQLAKIIISNDISPLVVLG